MDAVYDYLSDLSDDSVRCWDTSTGRMLDRWQARRQAYNTMLTSDGQSLLAHPPRRWLHEPAPEPVRGA